jgi:hypothetical protein
MEYVRVAIVVSLQLRAHYRKEALMSMLDAAMLDEKSLAELQTLISRDVMVPRGSVTPLR